MPSHPRIRHGEGRVFQLRVELEGIAPPVWRRVLVSGRASLHELHDVIEGAMGRESTGGYAFVADGVRYLDPEAGNAPGAAAAEASLESLRLHVGARFVHLAESHGDAWRHVLTVERIEPRRVGERLPACTAGGRAAPPEDCAGPGAYQELLDALAHPLDPHAAEICSWLPDHFDPEYADLTAINAALARIPRHRPAA